MANSKGRRRRFGALRQLPSGQWQARYRDPDGLMRSADTTFPTKTDAEVWLTCKEAEILNGDWINPDAGKVLLADYGTAWIEERANLRPKTIRLYRYLAVGGLAQCRLEKRDRCWRSSGDPCCAAWHKLVVEECGRLAPPRPAGRLFTRLVRADPPARC
jgi:hypothetical protein